MAKKRLHQTFDEVQEILDSVDSKTNVQSDWNENDSSKDEYVKNRTHWIESESGVLDAPVLKWMAPHDDFLGFDFWLDGTNLHSIYEPLASYPYSIEADVWTLLISVDSVTPAGRPLMTLRLVVSGRTYTATYTQISGGAAIYVYNDLTSVGIECTPASGNLYVPHLPYGSDVVHKLDNKFLDLASSPSQGGTKPITSGGVYDALIGRAKILSGTTAYWNSSGYRPAKDEVIVYTDKSTKVVDGQTVDVPGIKIGGGNAYVTDIAFVGDDIAASLITHINDGTAHITAAKKEFWDNKLNVNTTVVDETLEFTRN